MFADSRVILEPAGALALAGMKQWGGRLQPGANAALVRGKKRREARVFTGVQCVVRGVPGVSSVVPDVFSCDQAFPLVFRVFSVLFQMSMDHIGVPAVSNGVPGVFRCVPDVLTECAGVQVAIASGANMDFDRLRFVSERADYSENLVYVRIPERAGSFMALAHCVFPRNVTESAAP